jgi:hypothetical protein
MLSAIASSLISGLVSKHSLYEYLKLQYILKLRKEMPVIYRQNDEDTPNIVEPV